MLVAITFGKVYQYRVFGKHLALASYVNANVIELVCGLASN